MRIFGHERGCISMRSLTEELVDKFIHATLKLNGYVITLARRSRDEQAYFQTIEMGSCHDKDRLVVL